MRALGAALAPGGCVVANLWAGAVSGAESGAAEASEEARSARRFVRLLAAALGIESYGLRVVGHEKNRILLGLKPHAAATAPDTAPDTAPSDRPVPARAAVEVPAEALRARLLRAAEVHAAGSAVDAAMLATMRANAATVEVWS